MGRSLLAAVFVAAIVFVPTDTWGDDPPMPKQNASILLRRIDTNRDGKISRQEFRDFTAAAQRFNRVLYSGLIAFLTVGTTLSALSCVGVIA